LYGTIGKDIIREKYYKIIRAAGGDSVTIDFSEDGYNLYDHPESGKLPDFSKQNLHVPYVFIITKIKEITI